VTTGSDSVGKYSLVELLGEDGRCKRWRASRGDSGSEVLLTLMVPAALGGADAVPRFRAEIQRVIELSSPFVALVLDEGLAEETGAPYVVTELLRGQSLAERLSRTRLRARDVARYALQVGEALSEALEKGILHRDLRPENITLVGDADEEMVKIQDFGVASGIWAASLAAGQSFAESSPRAASYMSPEQLRAPKSVDHRTDLWSLAVIVFECLTGRHPFDTSSGAQQTKFNVKRGTRPIPSSLGVVPLGFDEWFARATARDLRARFQTAAEMTSALQALCCKPEANDLSRSIPRTLAPPIDVSWGVAVPAAPPPSPVAPPSSTVGASTAGAIRPTGTTGTGSALGASSLAVAANAAVAASSSGNTGAALPGLVQNDPSERVEPFSEDTAGGFPDAVAGGVPGAVAGALPQGPPVVFTAIRRDELRFLLSAGVLLGIAMVALAALWFRHRGPLPEPRVVPAEVHGAQTQRTGINGTSVANPAVEDTAIGDTAADDRAADDTAVRSTGVLGAPEARR
jgi:serine/threonine-protein kinase